MFLTGSVLLTLLGIPFGGLTTRFVQGVTVFVFARAALMPSHWREATAVSLAAALMLPLTMGLAAIASAPLRAQWSDPAAVLVFAHNTLFVLCAAAIGSAGSHMVWSARKQVQELRRLGSYRLRTRIGGGGVGDVWLAWQDPPGREVALKVLTEEASRDPDTVKRFEREARAVTRLTHPNTIRILDHGSTEDGVRYIAMELLHGLDVDALVRNRGPLPPARLIHLALQACGSLEEAHRAGIVHRDLKPANLFVARGFEGGDELKVLDFGLARVMRGATASSPSPATPEGIICGTPAFISPEAVSGDPVDARSDVYSLGAVLYFMATGTVVFPHLTIAECVLAHVGRAPEPPSKRCALVPPDVERIILRCLEKAPEKRYPGVAALAADLARCADAGKWTDDDAKAFWESAGRSNPTAA
jgi:serine/threonine-protein kinase